MSFLLRNRATNRSARINPHDQSKNDTTARPQSSSTNTTNHTIRGGNSIHLGSQIMLQRHRNQNHASSVTAQDQGQDVQGVISMSEVLADLRVLEMQQRDVQRKLLNTRAMKEQRLEQQVALGSKLENLKYSNGELRAQLRQSRDLLSTGTRSMGARRLVTDKGGGDIRSFEKKLKRGLLSARIKAACRRKIDSLFILAEHKLSALSRLKSEANAKFDSTEATMKEAVRKEESLRSSIQSEVTRAKEIVNTISEIRVQATEMEKDLLAAQNMEESTRTRLKALTKQIASDKTQQEAATSVLQSKVQQAKDSVASITKKTEQLSTEWKVKVAELDEAKKNRDASHSGDQDTLDFENLVLDTESTQEEIRTSRDANNALEKEIDQIKEMILKNDEITSRNQDSGALLASSTMDMVAAEKIREKELHDFSAELNKERDAISSLEKSSRELLDFKAEASAAHKEKVLDCETALEEARQAIDSIKAAMESDIQAYDDSRAAWETEKAGYQARMGEARENSTSAETSWNKLQQITDVEEESKVRLRQELLAIEQRKVQLGRETAKTIVSMTEGFPKLQAIASDFVYDSNASRSDQMLEFLGPLRKELETIVRAAKTKRGRKKLEAAEFRRKAAEAQAGLQRKDEKRRQIRARMKSELEKQEQAQAVNDVFDCEDSEASMKREENATSEMLPPFLSSPSQTVRNGASFYQPQSKGDFSEEETPAHPKSLLTNFSNAKGAKWTSSSSFNLTPNSDKRVHWKDDKSNASDDDSPPEDEALVKIARKSRQYGKGKRGLAAISGKKKDKKSPERCSINSSSHAQILQDGRALDRGRLPKSKVIAKSSLSEKSNSANSVPANANVSKISRGRTPKASKRSPAPVNNAVSPLKENKKSEIEVVAAAEKRKSPKEGGNDAFNPHRSEKCRREVKGHNKGWVDVLSKGAGAGYDTNPKKHLTEPSRHNGRSLEKATMLAATQYATSRSNVSDNSRASKRVDSTRSVGSGKSAFKSVTSGTSKASGRPKKSADSRKRGHQSASSTQASGPSSCDGAPKARRRKKSTTAQRSANLADESYAFAF